MLEIFELELAKSRRRKRLFNKAFKVFKEKIEPLVEKYKVVPLLSFYYECLPKNIKTKKEKELLVEILRTLTEKIYLQSNYDFVKELFFEYSDKALGDFDQKIRFYLWRYLFKKYLSNNLNNKEKEIAIQLLFFYEVSKESENFVDYQKILNDLNNFNKADKLTVLIVVLKIILKISQLYFNLELYFTKARDFKNVLGLASKVSARKLKKETGKWILDVLKNFINSGFGESLFDEQDFRIFFINREIKNKYRKPLKELKKEYLFDEENNKPGKIFERVSWLLYKKSKLYTEIFESKGVELCYDYHSFVEKNYGIIYQLSNFIFEKRVVGFRIFNLKELYEILRENKKGNDNLGFTKLKRNLFYKSIFYALLSSSMRLSAFKDKKFLKKYSPWFRKMYYEVNKEFMVAKKFYENTLQFLGKNEFYEKKLFFVYENLRIIENLLSPDLLKTENNLWFSKINEWILYLVNEALQKETFDPTRGINLDFFLFGVKIKTKKGKIIKGYVQKDFNDWLNYLFKHKPKETHFSDEKELYYKKFRR
jgi:hypothetical protein